MSGVTQGTRLAVIAAALLRHAELLCRGEVRADPDGTVHVEVTVPWQAQHAEAAELFQDMLRTVGEEQVRLFAARYGIPAERLQAFLPPTSVPAPDGPAQVVVRGDATVELERLFAYFCRRRGDGAAAHDILGELYDQLGTYYGDI